LIGKKGYILIEGYTHIVKSKETYTFVLSQTTPAEANIDTYASN